jgi:predicted methyltransferase
MSLQQEMDEPPKDCYKVITTLLPENVDLLVWKPPRFSSHAGVHAYKRRLKAYSLEYVQIIKVFM